MASKGLTRIATSAMSIMAEAAPIFARTFISAMAWRVEVFIEIYAGNIAVAVRRAKGAAPSN